MDVVGIAFIKNGKLLVSKSHTSKGIYTFVGGKVQEGESIYDASKRECEEEIPGFKISTQDFKSVLHFKEHATSDYNLIINMHILLATKDIDVELKTSDEILEYHWYSLDENPNILSSSIKDHFLPYAKKNGLLY